VKFNGSILAFGLAAILAGCGGVQNGAVTPVTGAQSRMHRASGSSGDLIYVGGPKTTYILSYDNGTVINTFDQSAGYAGLCSDLQGNVYMPGQAKILKFAHGGTSPIETLQDTGFRPIGCSVDPLTGDLAVANIDNGGAGAGNIAIFKNASGTPTFYNDPHITNYLSCGYDNSGNLFLDGQSQNTPFIFAELRSGFSTFQLLTLNQPVNAPGSVQWDGQYVAVGAYGARRIYRVKVSAGATRIVGTTKLDTIKVANFTFWIQGNRVLTAANPHRGSVGIWKYPRGGKPVAKYPVLQKGQLGGLTVSVAPTASRK
jgi:hypothetical protein